MKRWIAPIAALALGSCGTFEFKADATIEDARPDGGGFVVIGGQLDADPLPDEDAGLPPEEDAAAHVDASAPRDAAVTDRGPVDSGLRRDAAVDLCQAPPDHNCGWTAGAALPCGPGLVCCLEPGCPTAPNPYQAAGAVSTCRAPVAANGESAKCAAPARQLCQNDAMCGPGYRCDMSLFYCVPAPACSSEPENTPAACSDGCSNDGDVYVDCNDFDCCAAVACGANTSCGRSQCVSCDDGVCPNGLSCLRRNCDGRRACAANTNSICTTVDGVACPAVPVYGRCTDSSQCGDRATCEARNLSGTVMRCWPNDAVLRDPTLLGNGCAELGEFFCPLAPSSAVQVTAECYATACVPHRELCMYGCRLACGPGSTCPDGMTCTDGACTD